MFSYHLQDILWDFWRVMSEKAAVETDFANHQADCINAKVEVSYGK